MADAADGDLHAAVSGWCAATACRHLDTTSIDMQAL